MTKPLLAAAFLAAALGTTPAHAANCQYWRWLAQPPYVEPLGWHDEEWAEHNEWHCRICTPLVYDGDVISLQAERPCNEAPPWL
jgi:hypothetical protein